MLIGHGTRDPDGANEFRGFADDLAVRLGGRRPVLPCFLELAAPSILGGIEQCVEGNAGRIVAVPLFLFGANHVKTDVPAAINVARERHPELEIRFGAPFGVAPEVLEVVDERIAELEAALPPLPREETAVLLVERGSSDPDANAAVFQVARLLWEGRGFGWVEACFVGITRPSLDDGLARCVALGARRVLVLPYFLFTGLLVRRIERVVEARRERYPAVEFAVGRHLGRHPRLVDLAARRLAETERGEVRMSCDRCKYRVPLVGFEDQIGQPQLSDRDHGLRTDGDGAHEHGLAEPGIDDREAFFGGLAAQWKPRGPAELAKLREFLELAEVGPGQRVLDVGSGTGVLLPQLCAAVGSEGWLTALDVSPQMLGLARRRHAELRVRYLLGDAAAVPEPPASYDRVICNSVLPHFVDQAATLKALAPLLRPGGLLLISHDLSRAQLQAVHRRQGGPIAADRVPEPAALAAMLEAAGLDVVALHDGDDRFYALGRRTSSSVEAAQESGPGTKASAQARQRSAP